MTLEQRLEKLERENRWMRRIAAAGVAVVAAVFFVGQGEDESLPDLVVRSLTVKDKDGQARIRLRAGMDGGARRTELTLADPMGMRRIELSAGDHETSMRLTTRDGKLLHGVRAVHSSRQFSEWTFLGPQGRMGSSLSLGADSAGLRIHDGSNNRVALDALWDGSTRLTIFDRNGKHRLAWGTRADGTPDLGCFDAKGEVVWRAPED